MLILSIIIAGSLLHVADCDVSNSTRLTLARELTLTQKEKIAFTQFKDAVYKHISEDLLIIRQDLYLIRFLRSKKLNVEVAKRDLFAFLKYIRDNNLMTILSEEWKDLEDENPFYYDAVDREGRPVAYTTTDGGWNVRRAILQGKSQRLIRYIYKSVFEMYLKLVEAGRKNPDVTQFDLIMDLSGFNLIQHGCPLCLSTYIQLLQLYEKWVPGYPNAIIAVNAPQPVYVVLQTLRPFLSKHTNSVLKIFGTNKSVWKQYLDERIDPSQLPHFLGGTRPDPDI